MKGEGTQTDPFIYPRRDEIENIHEIIIRQRGVSGYGTSKGMIDACIEFSRTDTHRIMPFPTLETRASAILYSFISFHPFADGNKRTSLVATSYFLFMNGYSFDIPEDAPEFTKSVAVRCLDTKDHSVEEEVVRIRNWLTPHVSQGALMRIFYHLTRRRQTNLTSEVIWVLGFTMWNTVALAKIGEFIR